MNYDVIILGAGFYGLYAARHCGEQGKKVLVLEKEPTPFVRASFVNQARVHMGYHYPRSLTTAVSSAKYFDRFCRDFPACIYSEFDQIYATGSRFSWTTAAEYEQFCRNAGIWCEPVSTEHYFRKGMCDGAFLTKEYTFDAKLLGEGLVEEISRMPNVELAFSRSPEKIERRGECWRVSAQEICAETPFVLNATYAGVNEIHALAGFEPFQIKYEKCEIILCRVSDCLKNIGITVMDGPFFSLMPFGKTGLHSLTSVNFTPHETSYSPQANFACQAESEGRCAPDKLFNCNTCPAKPKSAWNYMSMLARKYLLNQFELSYVDSLYTLKPILQASEIDDSRPTVIRFMARDPDFVSVLSGKINTVYDLEEVLP